MRFPYGLTSYRTPPGTVVTKPDGSTSTLLVSIDPFFFWVGACWAASMEATPGALTLTVGGSAALTAVRRDEFERIITNGTLTWSSSNPAVAVVTSSGQVTGMSNGSAVIFARCGNMSFAVSVTVASS